MDGLALQRSWELPLAEYYARERHDGHLTILRFTTGWKAVFDTPDIEDEDRGYIFAMRTAPTPEEACRDLLFRERLLTVTEAAWLDARREYAVLS
jgi:hypothetical protein